MHAKIFVVFISLLLINLCEALPSGHDIEGRGKKKKIALFVYFADLIVKKIFILKLIYAFVFWVVLHKAGYFLSWFASYLKENKHEFHQYPSHHHHHEPVYEAYGPYRRKNQGR